LIAQPYELDGYLVNLQPGVNYTVSVSGASHGGTLPDPFVGVGDLATGQIILTADNAPDGNRDPIASLTVQGPMAGSYLVAVGDTTGGTGTYNVAVTDPQGNLAPGSFVIDFQAPPPDQSGTQFGGQPTGPFGPPPPPPSGSFSGPVAGSPFSVQGVPIGVMGVQNSAESDFSFG
jgi:hypothetical protein